jgi:hypothetical protein
MEALDRLKDTDVCMYVVIRVHSDSLLVANPDTGYTPVTNIRSDPGLVRS